MFWLSDGEKFFDDMFIRLTEFTNVTDGRTDTHCVDRMMVQTVLA